MENIQRAKKDRKWCSRSLIIREMQVKTKMRYHLTSIRMTIIKNSTNNKCWRGCGEKGMQVEAQTYTYSIHCGEQYGDSIKILRINPPYSQAILLHIYPEKTTIQKGTCAPVFISALFTRARTWNQPRCPSTDEWMKRIGILLSHKMEQIWVCCREVDEPRVKWITKEKNNVC